MPHDKKAFVVENLNVDVSETTFTYLLFIHILLTYFSIACLAISLRRSLGGASEPSRGHDWHVHVRGVDGRDIRGGQGKGKDDSSR